MKKLFLLLVVVIFGLYGCKNSKMKPELVVQDFYNYLNTGDVDKAKELASPTSKDFIDKLSALGVFKEKGDSAKFELMEIKKPEEPKQGDTAIVNYKIGDFKNNVALVWSDEKWQVIFNDNLKALRIIECNSIVFYHAFMKDRDVFWENYGGCRIRLKDLLYYVWLDGYAIPYDPSKMTILQPSSEERVHFTLCDKPLNYAGFENESSVVVKNLILISSYVTAKEADKLVKPIEKEQMSADKRYFIKYYNIQCSFDLEGILSGYKYDVLEFENCYIPNTKKCK